MRSPSRFLLTVVILSTITRDTLCRPLLALGAIESLNKGASVSSVVKTQTVTDAVGVEPVVLNDDGGSWFAGVAGGRHCPDLAARHSAPRSEIASMNAWSPRSRALWATARDW